MLIEISEREQAAILAGLRLLQDSDTSLVIDDIATNCGEFESLRSIEIDDLCERINFGVLTQTGG